MRSSARSLITTFQSFFQSSASAGIIIVVCTAIALVWTNSSFAESYHHVITSPISFTVGVGTLQFSLESFVNDGLMVIFFLLVGLEIKRELITGELSTRRKAMLPMIAAVSGMIVPGLIYAMFNIGTSAARGWAVPVATDIAFALGILALLGNRVPLGLKVFLAALAIVDDLLSVVVIAVFYTDTVVIANLAWAAVVVCVLIIANRSGIHNILFYSIMGIVLWVLFLTSGVHPTVSGVVLAMCIPLRARMNERTFLHEARGVVDRMLATRDEQQHDAIHALERLCEHVQSPLHRIEHGLQPWVSFVIMPLFTLVNAGVTFDPTLITSIATPIPLGIILGLFLGKQIGVSAAVWASVKLGWAEFPRSVRMTQLYGVSLLCGIGFTMALFVAHLSFPAEADLNLAKLGILTASLLSGIAGSMVLRATLPRASS